MIDLSCLPYCSSVGATMHRCTVAPLGLDLVSWASLFEDRKIGLVTSTCHSYCSSIGALLHRCTVAPSLTGQSPIRGLKNRSGNIAYTNLPFVLLFHRCTVALLHRCTYAPLHCCTLTVCFLYSIPTYFQFSVIE